MRNDKSARDTIATRIRVIGLGPGDLDYLSVRALDLLTGGQTVYLRTDRHPCVPELVRRGMRYRSFDALYDQSETFDEVYERIVDELIALTESGTVLCYAVPGNPFVAERTVELLLERVGREAVDIVHGVSFIDAMITTLGIDPVRGLAVVDALDETARPAPDFDSIYIQVYDRMTASQLKLRLSEVYGDDHEVLIVDSAGVRAEESVVVAPLAELDRAEHMFGARTSVFVPRRKPDNDTIHDLHELLRTLRGPGGCPWDQQVTADKLAQDLVEEANEVLEAVASGDVDNIAEELGDVLMLTVFQALLAEEEGLFGLPDVIRGVCEKMIRRHPHVFAGEQVSTPEEALASYYRAKEAEKSAKNKEIM